MNVIEYYWSIKKLNDVKKNNLKVFSVFSGGGGSSMGYKLAGYDVIGNCEIDPKMNKVYVKNLHPKYSYQVAIQKFKAKEDLPKELFNLDILDGSPPCSVFSMAGSREDKWGSAFKFKEGQTKQLLDDLFFDFLDLAERLQPKVIVAENVKGLIIGKAKGFVQLILNRFKEIGYDVQMFLLNSATMGVPQKRERVFFIAKRKDLDFSKLSLQFSKAPILYKEFKSGYGKGLNKNTIAYKTWLKRRPSDRTLGDVSKRTIKKNTGFNSRIIKDNEIMPTLLAGSTIIRYDEPYLISKQDVLCTQTFPYDYNFLDEDYTYICGMSVPPIMMKSISKEINRQWFKVAV